MEKDKFSNLKDYLEDMSFKLTSQEIDNTIELITKLNYRELIDLIGLLNDLRENY